MQTLYDKRITKRRLLRVRQPTVDRVTHHIRARYIDGRDSGWSGGINEHVGWTATTAAARSEANP
jgi:hypothetical protein